MYHELSKKKLHVNCTAPSRSLKGVLFPQLEYSPLHKTTIRAPDSIPKLIKVIGSHGMSERTVLLPDENPSLLLLLPVLTDPELARVPLDDPAVIVSQLDVTNPSSIVEVDEQEPTISAPAVGVTGR